MTSTERGSDRRIFRRVKAPIAVRPVSVLAHAVPRKVNDMSLGGLSAYSDEPYERGQRLELELLFPEGDTAVVLVEVVWVDEPPGAQPARYDVGMRFVDARLGDLERIAAALDR